MTRAELRKREVERDRRGRGLAGRAKAIRGPGLLTEHIQGPRGMALMGAVGALLGFGLVAIAKGLVIFLLGLVLMAGYKATQVMSEREPMYAILVGVVLGVFLVHPMASAVLPKEYAKKISPFGKFVIYESSTRETPFD